MSVSLKQIAQTAQVSVTTVSRVLRGGGDISDQTRKRVLDIAETLRYRPNLAAQSIFTGRTYSIGVIIPAVTMFDVRIAFGIHDSLAEQNVVPITLWNTPNNPAVEGQRTVEGARRQIHQLIDRRVDGVILQPINDSIDVYIQEIVGRKIPMVTVDCDYLGSHADFIGTDDLLGGRLAAQHLAELGHRKIVHLAGPDTVRTSRLRKEGFESVIASLPGIEYHCITDTCFGFDSKIADALFDLRPRPTAVFTANDMIAWHVYAAALRAGVRIPEELSVLGFADMELAEWTQPPLTTVRQHPYQIGKIAAQIMMDRIDGKLTEPQSILLKPELAIRSSTSTV